MKYILELSNDCNLKCEMCPRNHIDMEIGYMSKEVWDRSVRRIRNGCTVLPFWRGESTLHPDFCDRIRSLEGKKIVIATNGTNPEKIIDVKDCLDTVNVSIHNHQCYEGYLKIKRDVNGSCSVIASMVEGEEKSLEPDRVYKRHTIDGIWGRVDGEGNQPRPLVCHNLDKIIIGWNGQVGWCSHVWNINASPTQVCDSCDQWRGDGRTL